VSSIRFIDTTGLPSGFDVGDLIAQGTRGDALIAWMKARVQQGYPPPEERPQPVRSEPKPAPAEQAKKAPGDEGVVSGGSGRRAGEAVDKPNIPTRPRASTPPVAVVQQGNVATITRTPEPEPDVDIPPEYSDDALAEAFADRYGETMLYVAGWGKWMLWNGSRWEADETLEATGRSRVICREHGNAALVRPDLASKARGIATGLTSLRTIGNVERLARSDRRHAATSSQWDVDPWALNTPGGVVNLRTGELRPARKEDYVTKLTTATPGGACPSWLEFLRVATDGDDELIEFMRRMAGYCLTGITHEHALFFVYGTGGNGKGTFLNTMETILASYAKTASMEMFVEQKFQSHPTDVAGLMGARMVVAQETQEGKRWDEQRLKSFTGGDSLTARFMRQDEFTFKPQFKLVFSGNHKPSLRNVDEAIKRRLYMIPFTVTVPAEKRDRLLPQKLQAEAGGILQWAIDGCLDWQANTLAPPHRVIAATEEYFEQEDTIGQFLEECCDFNRHMRVKTSDLYARYQRWAENTGEYVLPRKRWLQQLSLRTIESRNIGGTMTVEGVGLRGRESKQQEPTGEMWDDER
jgi:putative DNA primase/helicase